MYGLMTQPLLHLLHDRGLEAGCCSICRCSWPFYVSRCRRHRWQVPRCRSHRWHVPRCRSHRWHVPRCRSHRWHVPRCRVCWHVEGWLMCLLVLLLFCLSLVSSSASILLFKHGCPQLPCVAVGGWRDDFHCHRRQINLPQSVESLQMASLFG